jgi:hypothetical protein
MKADRHGRMYAVAFQAAASRRGFFVGRLGSLPFGKRTFHLKQRLQGRADRLLDWQPHTRRKYFPRTRNRPTTQREDAAARRIVAHATDMTLYITHVPRLSA